MYFVHVYILKKKIKKKNSRFPNLSQKKEKNFQMKIFFELEALDFLVTFFQERPIFFFF